MKADKIVLKRFEELEAKASALLENKEFDLRSLEGVNSYKINSASFKAGLLAP